MKIDFVITWVDGNDLNWRKEKNRFLKEEDVVNNEVRFRDWELLKYWFRGIEKYTPWVNKIYFITWGHLPEWLDTNNEKLVIVNHRDYIPQEYLPTFNSHTIELNLHRIKNLEEHFVLFNDDTFVINEMKEEDFFKDGLPCDAAILNPIICEGVDHFSNVSANNVTLINNNFNKRKTFKEGFSKWYSLKYGKELIRTINLGIWPKFPGFYNSHLPNAFLKSSFDEIWSKEYETLDNTCHSNLRDNYTNVNQWVVKYWQFANNKFMPRSPKIGKYYEISNDNSYLKKEFLNKKRKLVCLNDSVKIDNFEKTKKEIINIFENILPDKSSYEK